MPARLLPALVRTRWRLHRQIGRFLALADAVNLAGTKPILVGQV